MGLKLATITLVFQTVIMFAGAGLVQNAYASPSQQQIGAKFIQPSATAVATQYVTMNSRPSQPVASAETLHSINAACCGDGCNPGRTPDDYVNNRWDGWKYNNGGNVVGGVTADIWNYSPWVKPEGSGTDFVTAWTMLTNDHPYGTDAGYAQIGWLEWQGGSRVEYEEFHEYGGTPITRYNNLPAQSVNVYTYYTTLYDPGTNTITFRQNSTTDSNFQLHPQTWRPTEGQVSGETLTLASQMPGGASSSYAHEDFFHSQIYPGGWKTFPNSGPNVSTFMADYYGNYQGAYFGQTAPSNGNISIYDLFCAN